MTNHDQLCDSCGYPITGEGHLKTKEDPDGHTYVKVLCEKCWRDLND